MFTGIIEHIGTVKSVQPTSKGMTAIIEGDCQNLTLGESIAIDGVCLTVAQFKGTSFAVDASAETLSFTQLGTWASGRNVHLERALRLQDRLGGHLVTGHVDGLGKILAREPVGESHLLRVEAPLSLRRFLAPKGSIAMQGVSLTINQALDTWFEVMLVPHTRKFTLFDHVAMGDTMHLEADILAKYVTRFLDTTQGAHEITKHKPDISLDFLAQHGYIRE